MVTFSEALESFEATEANLKRLEALCDEIRDLIPTGIAFGSDSAHDEKVRVADDLMKALPTIDGWSLDISFLDLDDVAQTRFDLAELGEPTADIAFERSLDDPQRQVSEYRYRFNKKRRELVRGNIGTLAADVEKTLARIVPYLDDLESNADAPAEQLEQLRVHFNQMNTLFGSMNRPSRWNDMGRHLHFGLIGDMHDIIDMDWPAIQLSMNDVLYDVDDAIPVAVADLGTLIAEKPTGPIPTRLQWENLDDEQFERLIFGLIATTEGYENPEWLMKTRAADRGRDLSVTRVVKDGLAGSIRSRVIIQCKNWQANSISTTEVAVLKEQTKHWEPPRVDVVIVATTGRFTSDAVALIEKHNQSDSGLRIEMWPSSHLEMLLASRPELIAEFSLR